MPNRLRIVVACIIGLVAGSAVNMALVTVGPRVIPPPPGADLTTVEGLRAAMPLLQPRHFIMPFLAHAVGTLVGALTGALLTASHRPRVAFVVGAFFLVGGIAASTMIPAPAWFKALDLVAAYLPMAWLGLTLANHLKPGATA